MKTDKLIRLFYPKVCSACGKIVPIEQDICGCMGKDYYGISSDFCRHCGADSDSCFCRNEFEACLEEITAPYYYAGAVKERLLDFKFNSEKYHGSFFGDKMALRFAEFYPTVKADVVTFVPMEIKAKKERGYNQSEILAKQVAKRLFLPCRELIIKTKSTKSQHSLSAKERTENLVGAFERVDNKDLSGKVIILCDDIKTTGTTLLRCAEVLRQANAEKVYCLCAAVTQAQ